jgi:acetaldehyde dehydrogenase (acetylating)
MTNCIIIGTGKIGIDLYIKLKKKKIFNKVFIFNKNKKSEGAIYCQKKNFLYSDSGVEGIISKLKETNIIFDCTSAKSNLMIIKKLKNYLNKLHYINLTPSKFGSYVVPYFNSSLIPKKINLITCGGQTSIPIIASFKRILKKKLKYVELVSSISAKSAGKATRDNINEYIINTESAIKQLAKVNKTKVIININPSEPPVNMMNSLFFELNNKLSAVDYKKIQFSLKNINKKIKFYIPDYNAILFKTFDKKIFRVTVRVVGQGDYLPTYAGNLDIITSSAVYLSQQIQKKYK